MGDKQGRCIQSSAITGMGLLFLVLFIAQASWARDDAAIALSRDELKGLLGNPDVTIIDVRFGRDWYDSPIKIKGAIHEDPMKPGTWIDRFPKDRMLVLYCN
jgi:hypothetical protein